MKKLSVALVGLAAFCGVAVAQAKPTEGPKVVSNVAEAQKLGEQRFKLTEQVCQVSDAYKASDATWMGDMPEDKFKLLLRTCVTSNVVTAATAVKTARIDKDDDDDMDEGPDRQQVASSGYGPRDGKYSSFKNLAEGSHTVKTRRGVFNVKGMGGPNENCQPPRQLVRTEQCHRLGNGMIRCKLGCR